MLVLQSHFKGSVKDEEKTMSAISIRKPKESSSVFEVGLEKQLQAWKENPTWVDQSPDIEVGSSVLRIINSQINYKLTNRETNSN